MSGRRGRHLECWLFVTAATCAAVCLGSDVLFRPEEDKHCNRTVDIYQAISSPPVTDKNRNQPLHCVYRIRVRPPRSDWVVYVRFTRMRVGEPSEDRKNCVGGYVQIVDGYRESNHSNKEAPGFYCGEIDSPKTFMSETPHVKIILHVDSYNHESFLQFDANVEQQQEMHARYGQYAQLYPHRRGTIAPGSYCDRIFHSCAPTRCFLQSPGYPGIYPRNLRCRYNLVVTKSAVALDLNAFDVDGLRCDNLLLCFPRPLTKNSDDCPFDYVRIYDGPSDDNPLMVTLCGRGKLKSQVVASGSEMLVEFVTSPAGPLLNTGFHFNVESVYGESESEYETLHLINGSCTIEKRLKDSSAVTYANLRSWYPPNTTCTYKFTAADDEIIKLSFDFFRMERVTLCEESLKLYDASFADPSKIMSKLCDINKPRTEQPRSIFETSGSSLFIEFISKIGSLKGSSLSYAFEVKPVNMAVHKNNLSHHPCRRRYTPDGGMSGYLTAAFSELNSTSTSQPLTCNYSFDASSLTQGRVELSIFTSLRPAASCEECYKELLYAEVMIGLGNKICFCKVSSHRSHTITSFGPHLQFSLHAEMPWDKKLPQKQVVNGSYTFYSESKCGPDILELDVQGALTFPSLNYSPGTCPEGHCESGPLSCSWKIPVFHRMDLVIKIEGLASPPPNCTTDYIVVDGTVVVCPSALDQEVLLHKEDIETEVAVAMRLSSFDRQQQQNTTIRWTQLRILPNSHTRSENLVSLGKDCDFLCTTSMACLTRELVCNGVGNCPGVGMETPADENPGLCFIPQDNFKLYWWIIGFGLGVCVCLTFCLVYTICRKCHVGRHRI